MSGSGARLSVAWEKGCWIPNRIKDALSFLFEMDWFIEYVAFAFFISAILSLNKYLDSKWSCS